MELGKQNILFFTRTMGLGGTENVVLQLCEILKPHVNRIVVCSCGGVNEKRLKQMGIKHYKINDIENKSISSIALTIKQLRNIVDAESITIIHTHHRMAAFYVTIMRLYKKCIFINTSHNTFYNKKHLTRFAYKHCNLIACGEMVKNNLQTVFGLKEVTVINNSVKPFMDEIKETPCIIDQKKKGRYLIGNVGRLSEQKGMEFFIDAIPEVVRQHQDVCFFIIGSGEKEHELKRKCDELLINDKLLFLGYRNDVQNIMAQLDLIVLSSLWEGFPLTPIEAFSVGKTIIGTSVDGTKEIVKNGKNGILIEPRNSKQISKAINWMIDHPSEKIRMDNEAKKTYETLFSIDHFTQSYLNFYRGLLC